jgi:transcriptional regulator with XRE-family HTH domain
MTTQDETIKMWKEALGTQLAIERKGKGLNQQAIAEKLGISQRTVSEIERGLNPVIDHMLRYAELVDLDFAVLAARARVVVQARQIDEPSPL